jgi:hypothetical protein
MEIEEKEVLWKLILGSAIRYKGKRPLYLSFISLSPVYIQRYVN